MTKPCFDEAELRIREVNEAVDWGYLSNLSHFITNPHAKNVWRNRQFRMVRESKDGDGCVFDDTNNVKPHIQTCWYEMTTEQFMELNIDELLKRPEHIANAVGTMLDYLLHDVHTLLGVADVFNSWMPRIYQYTQVGAVIVATACWGNTIDEHGNETGEWGKTVGQQIREMTGE